MIICTQSRLNLWATQRPYLSAKEIAEQEGCSHDAMRRRFSDNGVPSPFAIRREIIAGLYKRGTDREIVRYILLHRGWTISVEAVKMIRWRMDLKKRRRLIYVVNIDPVPGDMNTLFEQLIAA